MRRVPLQTTGDPERHWYELHGSAYMQITFSVRAYVRPAFCISGSRLRRLHQPRLQAVFLIRGRSLQMQRAGSVRCSVPVHRRDFSIRGFACPQGLLEPLSHK